MGKFLLAFKQRHDHLSMTRQRSIASMLLWANLALAALIAVSVFGWQWHVDISKYGWVSILAAWAASLLLVGLCSDIPLALQGARPDPGDDETDPLAEIRKFLYYPGSCLNFIAIAILIEETGGVIYSPFTPVLLAMILAAQTLGRYRVNSLLYVSFGALLLAGMLIWDKLASVAPEQPAPGGLLFFILAISFAVAAMFSHVGKPHNFRVDKVSTELRMVEVYRDSDNIWRYAFYGKKGRIDGLVFAQGGSGERTLNDVKVQIKEMIKPNAGDTRYDLKWESWTGTESLGRIIQPKEPAPVSEATGS